MTPQGAEALQAAAKKAQVNLGAPPATVVEPPADDMKAKKTGT